MIKGTTTGVATDAEGAFSLTAPSSDDTLVVSSIGYEEQTIPIEGRNEINISLSSQALQGDEVVVVGYGTQTRQDVTGAIGSVSSDDLESQAVSNLDDALQGQISGVQITSNSGTPGGEMMVRIRGTGTINNAGPLYVIDGNPMSNPNNLNPSDVESVEVLKSASASAIYGSRGANGVVLITTKDGQTDGMSVEYNMYMGVQNTPSTLELTSGEEYATLYNEALTNAGDDPVFDDPSQYGQGTDWQSAIFQSAPISNHNLAFSGGNDKSVYRISGDFISQEGIVIDSEFDKLDFTVNSSHEINDWLDIGQNLDYTYSSRVDVNEQDIWGNPIWSAILADPTAPVRQEDGSWGHPRYATEGNPVATINFDQSDIGERVLNGNVHAIISPMDVLSFKSQFNINTGNGKDRSYTPVYDVYQHQQNDISQLEESVYEWTEWAWETTAQYENSFGGHNVEGLLGFTAQNATSSDVYAVGQELPPSAEATENLRYLGLSSSGYQAAGGAGEWGMMSFLGRVDYDYQSTYLATVNFRRDGSSRFGSENQWGNFPSFSLGWRISNESFMDNADFVDDLKIRGGWGELGNQGALSNYAFVSTLETNIPYFLGQDQLVLGQTPSSLANQNLKWETVSEWDFGIDFTTLDNRLTVNADYYNRETSDMLVQLPIADIAGIPEAPYTNAGTVLNEGFELTVGYQQPETEGFNYGISANISTFHNEVTSLNNSGASFASGNVKNNDVSRTEVGHPIASFYGHVTDGIFQNQQEVDEWADQPGAEPGDIRFKDLNGDGEIGSEDRDFIGSPWPDFTYGLSGNLRYNNLDMSFTFSGSYGNEIFAGWRTWSNAPSFFNYYAPDMLNSWDGEGSTNENPRLNAADPNSNVRVSDRFVEDGSYVKLKNIQLGYTLPQSILERWNFQNLRIYVSARNLFTITSYEGLDPEVGMNSNEGPLDVGIDRGIYPQARTLTAGLNLSF